MAIVPMDKVVLLTHKSEKEGLLKELQREGIVHISDLKESNLIKDYPEFSPPEITPELEEISSNLSRTITFLSKYEERGGVLSGLLKPKILLNSEEFEKIVNKFDPIPIIKKCAEYEQRQREIATEENHIHSLIELVSNWIELDYPLEEIKSTDKTRIVSGFIPNHINVSKVKESAHKIEAFSFEIVTETPEEIYCIVAYLKEVAQDAEEFLSAFDFEIVDFGELKGKPKDIVSELEKDLSKLRDELDTISRSCSELVNNLPKLRILSDHYTNLISQKTAENNSIATKEAVYIEGWARRRDYKKLESLLEKFTSVSMSKVSPEVDEEPPTDLENKKPFRPFEFITELYGMPHSYELDPTPLLAPFFAIFFGLCLTDAGYGIILAVLSFIMMKKFPGGKKLLQLLFISAIATVVMGAITGGWFGDAFKRIPFSSVRSFRKSVMLFDPMETPMLFFLIAVGLGYFQIMFGLCLALYDNLRKREYLPALFSPIMWLVLLNSLVLLGLSAAGIIPKTFISYCKIIAPVAGLCIFFFKFLYEKEESLFARFVLAGFTIFSVVFYVGDVLSYLRLMALGMVTAGIAMAVNIIAGIVGGVPIVGVIFAVIVLIGGHLFNLAINTLGAFVHTLRLQYVEFFPKFFQGGGKQFKPLRIENKYVIIT